jgi:hypothetical protein
LTGKPGRDSSIDENSRHPDGPRAKWCIACPVEFRDTRDTELYRYFDKRRSKMPGKTFIGPDN